MEVNAQAMSTIIKMGVVLTKINPPQGELYPSYKNIYGDLHIVGQCCILYFPFNQVRWDAAHGWIDLTMWGNLFCRPGGMEEGDGTLVIPAKLVTMRKGSMHPLDEARFLGGGGTMDHRRGELG